jgi:hypothetical protein
MMATRKRRSTGMPSQKVEIDFVLLADFAQAVGGKLTVVGAGWNLWNAKQFPSVVPFGIGIGFLVPWGETNRPHRFTFAIVHDGKELAGGGGDFEVGRKTGIPPGMDQRVVIGLSGQVEIQFPGTYEIVVSCAGSKKRVTFEALPRRQLAPPS